MSVTFGCLSLMSLRNPFTELAGMVLGKSDLRSILCLLIFCIVSLVLAYLTNPSENSFRAYLTEQSFRHHLSRLDDHFDDEQGAHRRLLRQSNASHLSGLVHPHLTDNTSRFHFANRAAVSLRTPKHVFHSFAIFTIAAMVPLSKVGNNGDRDGWTISDSWYIGAFGKWWRGGVLETWYQDVIARSKDEESWSSGILGMKNLDMLPEFNGSSFAGRSLPHHILRGSPPRLRNRDRPIPRSLSIRSSTPPPLSKTASLPLHSTSLPSAPVDRSRDYAIQPSSRVPASTSGVDAVLRLGSISLPSRSPSNLFEHSPLIAEVLRQISTTTSSVQELRIQYNDCQNTASQSHELLQTELDSYRDRKRQDDTLRVELKTRTKILDDSKRSAEILRKDAEKKLRAAQTARDSATRRMEHLDNEIGLLHGHLQDDQQFLERTRNSRSEIEFELSSALEQKKREIRSTEELLVTLTRRSRELEERLTMEKERLTTLKEKSDLRKHEISPALENSSPYLSDASYAALCDNGHGPGVLPYLPTSLHDDHASDAVESNFQFFPVRETQLSQLHSQPLPHTVSAASSINCIPSTYANGTTISVPLQANRHLPLVENGMSLIDVPGHRLGNIPSVSEPEKANRHYPAASLSFLDNDDGVSRSFQSENDMVLDRHWHRILYSQRSVDGFSSLASLRHGNLGGELNPCQLRTCQPQDFLQNYFSLEGTRDLEVMPWTHQDSIETNSMTLKPDRVNNSSGNPDTLSARSWVASTTKPKKGLNPDAKIFSLSRKSSPGVASLPSNVTYDALNPTGLGISAIPTSASTSDSLLRAFAPSPAERAALQRALGGSTNTSFERLPSLSDVGSIPSSPSHARTSPPTPHLPRHASADPNKVLNLPSWLSALPKVRKSKFRPWDDDETGVADGKEDSVQLRNIVFSQQHD